MKKNLNVLIADTESIVITDLKDKLHGWGYRVSTPESNDAFTSEWIKKNNPDAVIIDDDFPFMEAGIKKAMEISQQHNIGVILVCAWMNEKIKRISSELKSFQCLSKPFTNEELQRSLERILTKQNN